MDDTQNKPQLDTTQTPPQQAVPTVQQDQQAVSQPVSQPQSPVGGPHKEMAPVPQPTTEYLKPTTESQPELSQELAEIGVEHATDQEKVTIPHVVQQAGVTHAKESVPVHTSPQGTVQLMDTPREELVLRSKAGPVTEAARWFALFLLRQVDKVAYQKVVTKS